MKIGVLTYTKEYRNLGTNMQCYCTLQAIRNAYPGARVELVDYCATRPSRRPYLSQVTFQSIWRDYRRVCKYDEFFKRELIFSGESLTTPSADKALEFIKRQRYDAIYVGSDTVLELTGVGSNGVTPYWLGDRIPAVKILAAASSLNLTYEALSERQRALLRDSIASFAMLGARDDATYRLLSRFTDPGDPRLELVPDPTFTYAIDYAHIQKYLARRQLRFTSPVVCLHLLRGSPWAERLGSYFRQAGYLVASLRPARYADIILTDLSPFEQMGIYRYFSLVVTHRFHDAVFCLKSMTPVLAFPERASDITSFAESKLLSLLSAFGVASTSYIASNETITAESIIERYPSAITRFVEAGSGIETVLREKAERYSSFIRRSRLLIEGKE